MKSPKSTWLLVAAALCVAGCVEFHNLAETGEFIPPASSEGNDGLGGVGSSQEIPDLGDVDGTTSTGDSSDGSGASNTITTGDSTNDSDSTESDGTETITIDLGDLGIDLDALAGLSGIETASAERTSTIPPLPNGATLSTSASGLKTFDIVEGSGEMPTTHSTVRIGYVGFLEDGTVFDSNEDITFDLDSVIAGFAEGLSTMREGGERRIIIPPDLGYGAAGNPGAGIGGEDTIIFDVTLHSIEEL